MEIISDNIDPVSEFEKLLIEENILSSMKDHPEYVALIADLRKALHSEKPSSEDIDHLLDLSEYADKIDGTGIDFRVSKIMQPAQSHGVDFLKDYDAVYKPLFEKLIKAFREHVKKRLLED